MMTATRFTRCTVSDCHSRCCRIRTDSPPVAVLAPHGVARADGTCCRAATKPVTERPNRSLNRSLKKGQCPSATIEKITLFSIPVTQSLNFRILEWWRKNKVVVVEKHNLQPSSRQSVGGNPQNQCPSDRNAKKHLWDKELVPVTGTKSSVTGDRFSRQRAPYPCGRRAWQNDVSRKMFHRGHDR
jgi:hypothetical protein